MLGRRKDKQLKDEGEYIKVSLVNTLNNPRLAECMVDCNITKAFNFTTIIISFFQAMKNNGISKETLLDLIEHAYKMEKGKDYGIGDVPDEFK